MAMMPVRDTFPDQPRAVLFPITDISGAEDGGLRGKGADLHGETYSAVSKTYDTTSKMDKMAAMQQTSSSHASLHSH